MKRYRLTEKDDAQPQEIWRYTRDRWGKHRADAYLASIDAALTTAIATPTLLRRRPELGDGIVSRKAHSHVVYGIVIDDTLIVLAVLHGRMDPKRHLIGDER
jgi:toxin ParE1/3/4